jgi:hypothetical protein
MAADLAGWLMDGYASGQLIAGGSKPATLNFHALLNDH